MESLLFHCVVVSVVTLGLVMSAPAHAQDAAEPREPPKSQQDRGREPRKPPPEAYSACAKATANDTCSVSFGQRTIEGTCTADRDDGTLFCRPNHPPGPQR